VSRRPTVLVLAVAGGSLVAAAATAAAGPAGRSNAGPAAAPHAVAARVPVFASPTVVDNYRPGFEPDVAVDRSPGGARRLYTSTPFGFSTTQSFIERSDDGADSFHLIEGNAAGKPITCVGGGDTEAQVDPVNGSLFFSDLQPLSNFSNSRSDDHGASFQTTCGAVTGTLVDRQWIGLYTNGATKAVGAGPSGGRSYFYYDNVAQDPNGLNNQLVINQSVDGVQYGSGCAAGLACTGPATVISEDEGLPGNLIVDNTTGPFRHSVYAAHTNSALTGITVAICRGAAGRPPLSASAAADYCTDPTAFDSLSRKSSHWQEVSVDGPADPGRVDKAFNVIQVDSAGNLYMTWASAPIMKDANGNFPQTAPAQIYYSRSTDGGQHWSPRVKVNAPAQATNIFPWITAGDAGRVAIAWYGSEQTTGKAPYDSDSLDNGLWDVYLAQTTNGLDQSPSFTVTTVSDHHVKYGNISTGGLGGASDRSLGDYMQVQTGLRGEAVVSYVDDTSTGRNQDFTGGSGQSPPEASGPTMIAHQIGGPSLLSTVGDLGDATPATDGVTDPTGVGVGDSFVSQLGTATAGSAAQDIAAVAVSRPDPGHLTFTLRTADQKLASDLRVDPTQGGTTGVWMIRWADRYEPALKDGAIRYVAMQSTLGGTPEFYTGTTSCIATARCKYISYPATTDIPGKISGDTITWTVPLGAIGNPGDGAGLFSVTGSTAVQPLPSQPPAVTLPTSGDVTNTQLPNLVDAAKSFSYSLRTASVGGTTVSSGPAPAAGPGAAAVKPRKSTKKVAPRRVQRPRQPTRTLAFTGLDVLLPVAGLALLTGGLLIRRRRRPGL